MDTKSQFLWFCMIYVTFRVIKTAQSCDLKQDLKSCDKILIPNVFKRKIIRLGESRHGFYIVSSNSSFLGLLAGPSGIRAGWVIETKSRLGAE